ncbi:hypothetical protein WJX73_007158 [Symbiochloris irregularis]|uniref:Uncharacterized protein n=1 Tax=Symbiochloris irregularis TaxID=706552 RepID=A0AAW1PBG2_9CHLO
MSSRHTLLLLKALRYPGAAPQGTQITKSYRQVVAWLEDNQIRQLKQEDRGNLLATNNSAWQVAYEEYLLELDCPFTLQAGNATGVLEWLLHLAVGLCYQDNCVSVPQNAASPAQQQPPGQGTQTLLDDLGSQQLADGLQKLRDCLQMQTSSSSQADDLQAARDVIVEQILPLVESTEAQQRSGQALQHLSSLDADAFPLGFSTGDPGVDLAGTILRMLFIKDLRQLQTVIDETMVQVQEFTANPRTDSTLGRVGR